MKRPDRPNWGRYRAQYVYRCPNVTCRNRVLEPAYRPAADIIDWGLLGQRIGDKPLKEFKNKKTGEITVAALAPKTLARIQAGIDRYWAPLLVPVEGRDGKSADPTEHAMRTMTTRSETGFAFMVDRRGEYRTRGIDDPVSTVTATETTKALALAPFIAELRGGGSKHRSTSDPLCTVVANGNHHGLVTAYYGNGGTQPTEAALSTVTATERHGLLMRNNSTKGSGAEHVTPVEESIRTITTTGHQSLLTADRRTIDINDVLFRMLEPREIKGAMDFPTAYRILGNRREQVRQAGNAVCPPNARDHVGVVAESLGAA